MITKTSKNHLICINFVRSSLTLFCFFIISPIITKPTFATSLNNDLIDDQTNWDNVFSSRTDDDWKNAWHTEKHRRCYQDLLIHMEWVCQKDIYKVKRKKKRENDDEDLDEVFTKEPFISANEAHSLGLNRMKRHPHRRPFKRGIMDECCQGTVGCSWEEYAEYCPANKRIRI